ncbi:YggS family pyridoxal phosphate-dependent enzyme [Krasilnikovia sp. M28-CT-15]|uniref:YggS family pyridoxal phosphate-dependent enzyme n=1 Tax=Krasilnikovia sp. M28-CT-15 TaxID=3373540 RepID=UPI00387715D0
MTTSSVGAPAEVRERVDRLRADIARVAVDVGRDPEGVHVVAVTKTFPAEVVQLATDLGFPEVAENRVAELVQKHDDQRCAAVTTWHFIGQVQRNKARQVARYSDVIHSVDRPSLVEALSAAAVAEGRVLSCLIQLKQDNDPQRGGALPADLMEVAERIAAAPGLVLGGLMAMPAPDLDPAEAYRAAAAEHRRLLRTYPTATTFSAGMTGDWPAAVAAGATHLRLGAAIVGPRAPRAH